MIRLHDYELSGNCFKVRQFLTWLNVPFERLPVDFHPGRMHKSDEFLLRINPLGQIPVLEDGNFILRETQAILIYLATRFDASQKWFPNDAQQRAQVAMWLAAADTLTQTASAARLGDVFGFKVDIDACRSGAHNILRTMDDHLAERTSVGFAWLVGENPTLADLACFPYAALAPEGGLVLDAYPEVRRWIWDFRHLSGFIGMAGILAPLKNNLVL